MKKKYIIEKTKEYVKNKLEGEGSGHDWWHIVRSYNNAVDIAKKENITLKKEDKKSVDMFIVELGALLHDIADHKFGYSDDDRKSIITDFLEGLGVEVEVIDHVVYIANNISFKGGKNKHKMETIEGMIVQDADRLDAVGAIGIGRTFAYGGYKKRVMYDPDDHREIDEKEDTVNHFYEKLLLLKDRMNTQSGYEKALSRHRYMEEFLEQFYGEWDGER
ncbi:MAG: HD domain-containing protein [Psychrilyobacter sp.]|nr:HD domain-containing protein [Psychrilyobacter sp.]